MTHPASGERGGGPRRPSAALAAAALALGVGLGAATLAGGAAVVTPAPAAAQSEPSSCPAMTDSVARLYHAFFRREPDADGFRHWVRQYQTGSMSLEQIADAFLRSPEFTARQIVSNQAFVDWLYADVLGPDVPRTRADDWIRTLNAGYSRSTAVLTFTESFEYVRRTSTVKPLAGYLRWYPPGTHWYCDTGPATRPVNPLTGGLWADYYLANRSPADDPVAVWTMEAVGHHHVTLVDETLATNSTDYNWDGAFNGDGKYGQYIEVKAGADTDWIVVFYPNSIGPERLGWQLTP